MALALDEGLEKGLAHVCAVILRPQLEAGFGGEVGPTLPRSALLSPFFWLGGFPY